VTIAAFELLWDELAGRDYAYLWLAGRQYVAYAERPQRPRTVPAARGQRFDAALGSAPSALPLTFDPQAFTMRPLVEEVPPRSATAAPTARRSPSKSCRS
jgi:hypothetical protein